MNKNVTLVRYETDTHKHTCSLCGKTFAVRRDLVKHTESMHTEKSRQGEICPSCKKRFKDLEDHIAARHTGVSLTEIHHKK